jgi:hypothetical protein
MGIMGEKIMSDRNIILEHIKDQKKEMLIMQESLGNMKFLIWILCCYLEIAI